MKQDAENWLLIANAARAAVYRYEEGSAPVLRHAFTHPDSRKRTAELGDDRPGRELSDRGWGTSYQPRVDEHRKQHLRFAHEIAVWLEHEARTGGFGALQVFAANPFLGELKLEFGTETRRALQVARNVDLSSVGPAELGRRVAHELSK